MAENATSYVCIQMPLNLEDGINSWQRTTKRDKVHNYVPMQYFITYDNDIVHLWPDQRGSVG